MEYTLPLEQYSAVQDSLSSHLLPRYLPCYFITLTQFQLLSFKEAFGLDLLNFLLIVSMSHFWLKNNMAKHNFYKLNSINDNQILEDKMNWLFPKYFSLFYHKINRVEKF